MDTAVASCDWVKPGARIQLFALRELPVHYARPGESVALCGTSCDGHTSRGMATAESVYIMARVGHVQRRLTAKNDCLTCMRLYCTAMRPYENKM